MGILVSPYLHRVFALMFPKSFFDNLVVEFPILNILLKALSQTNGILRVFLNLYSSRIYE